MFLVFLITVILLTIVVIGLAITIILKKNGKFPDIHIGENKALRDKGIHCATTQDRLERASNSKK